MKIGPYEVLAEVGRGGAGVVYRARAPGGGDVALKVLLRAELFARFDRERRLLASLGEAQGFVSLLDAGESPSGPYLVMPLISGGTLRSRLDRGPLPVAETLELGRAIAAALAIAHEAGIVHRDLKPENIIFTSDGKPLVADLGIAKHLSQGQTTPRSISLSTTGELRGTFGYMPPEQMLDARSVDARADVFAVGAILYECLGGRPAFTGETPFEVLGQVDKGAFVPMEQACPEAPSWLARVIVRALSVDAGKRPADGAELSRALEGPPPASRRFRRVGIAVAVLAAVVGAAWLTWGRGADESPPAPSPRPTTTVPRTAPTPPAASERSRWRSRAPLPTPRMKTAATVTPDGRIYVSGGRVVGGAVRTVEEYDPEHDTWSPKAPLLTARLYHGAATLGGKVYVAGGTVDERVSLATVEEYDPAINRWREVAPLPSGRWAITLVPCGGRLWALGGIGQDGQPPRTAVYDPALDSWTEGPPVRDATTVPGVSTANRIVVFQTERILLGRLDPALGHVHFEPVPRLGNDVPTGAATGAIGERVFVIGGTASGVSLARVTSFEADAAGVQSREEPPLILGRRNLAAVSANGKLYAIGGYVDGARSASDAVEELAP